MAQDPSLKLAREKAKIERDINAIKKKARDDERTHTDVELKKLEDYRKRKRQIAKEQAKDEEASIANENKKYGLQSIQTQLQEKVMIIVKKQGKQQKFLTQEYYKQGLHLHGFLETGLRFSNQVAGLNKNIEIGESMFDSQSKVIQRFAPDFAQLVEGQKESMDLSQKIGQSYDEMGKGSFQDLTKEAEEQVKMAQNQKKYIDEVAAAALQAQADKMHGNSKEKKEILERIKQMKAAANLGVRTAKNNEAQAQKIKVLNDQTAAAADAILDPFQKLQGVLESTKMGKLASEIVGVDDVMKTFSNRLTTDLSNSLDESNKMNFGLAFNNLKVYGQKALDSLSDGFKKLGTVFGGINKAMGGMLGPALAIVAVLMIAKKVAEIFYGGMLETRKEFGLTFAHASKLQSTINATAMEFKMLGVSAEDVKAGAQGIMDNLGGIGQVTRENLQTFARLNGTLGLSGESAGLLAGQMMAVGASSMEAVGSQLESVGALAQANGVAPAKVLEDVAGASEAFAEFAKDGGENVFKAAISARKLGISMDTVAGAADALLDFESSINAQMEASMLTGRNINTDKARE